MRIKAPIVAYAFSVQYFENTIVAYAGLRVNHFILPQQTLSLLQNLMGFPLQRTEMGTTF